jgi:hypothetical protein
MGTRVEKRHGDGMKNERKRGKKREGKKGARRRGEGGGVQARHYSKPIA